MDNAGSCNDREPNSGTASKGVMFMALLKKVVQNPSSVQNKQTERIIRIGLQSYTEELVGSGNQEKAVWLYENTCNIFKTSCNLRLDLGLLLYRLGLWNDALSVLDKCLTLKPTHALALESRENLINLIVERWHFRMLNDHSRNLAYREAIHRSVAVCRKPCTVLDIGAGTGLLSIYAAEAGANVIYACEVNASVAEVAQSCVHQNQKTFYSRRRGLDAKGTAGNISSSGDRESYDCTTYPDICVLNKHSTDLRVGVDFPERVDLVITELVDAGLVGEHILPVLADARARLLKPYGIIVPHHAYVWGMVINSDELRSRCRVDVNNSTHLLFADDECYTCENLALIPHTPLCDPVMFGTIPLGFDTQEFFFSVDTIAHDSGTADALVTWFDLHLLEDEQESTKVSTSPCRGLDCGWDQCVHYLPYTPNVNVGASVSIELRFRSDDKQEACVTVNEEIYSPYLLSQTATTSQQNKILSGTQLQSAPRWNANEIYQQQNRDCQASGTRAVRVRNRDIDRSCIQEHLTDIDSLNASKFINVSDLFGEADMAAWNDGAYIEEYKCCIAFMKGLYISDCSSLPPVEQFPIVYISRVPGLLPAHHTSVRPIITVVDAQYNPLEFSQGASCIKRNFSHLDRETKYNVPKDPDTCLDKTTDFKQPATLSKRKHLKTTGMIDKGRIATHEQITLDSTGMHPDVSIISSMADAKDKNQVCRFLDQLWSAKFQNMFPGTVHCCSFEFQDADLISKCASQVAKTYKTRLHTDHSFYTSYTKVGCNMKDKIKYTALLWEVLDPSGVIRVGAISCVRQTLKHISRILPPPFLPLAFPSEIDICMLPVESIYLYRCNAVDPHQANADLRSFNRFRVQVYRDLVLDRIPHRPLGPIKQHRVLNLNQQKERREEWGKDDAVLRTELKTIQISRKEYVTDGAQQQQYCTQSCIDNRLDSSCTKQESASMDQVSSNIEPRMEQNVHETANKNKMDDEDDDYQNDGNDDSNIDSSDSDDGCDDDSDNTCVWDVDIPIDSIGDLHSVVFWFCLAMPNGRFISNAPSTYAADSATQAKHIRQAAYIFETPKHVEVPGPITIQIVFHPIRGVYIREIPFH